MLLMARKKKTEAAAPVEADADAGQFHLRYVDERIPAAIDAYAKSTRRSKNMAMNILLEEGLARAGFWPPKE